MDKTTSGLKESEPKSQVVSTKPSNKLSQAARDQHAMRNFLNPMMDDLEKAVAENMKQLDKLEEELLASTNKERAERAVSHIPSEIRNGKPIKEIFEELERLLSESFEFNKQEEAEADSEKKKAQEFINSRVKFIARSLNSEHDSESATQAKISKRDINNLCCLANSLTSYLITSQTRKSGDHLKNLTIKLYESVNLWISRLFRFYDSSIFFHDQEFEGLIRMCNMMLNFKYEDYQARGYKAIGRQPAIYVSESSKYSQSELKDLISIQLGLPNECIRVAKVGKQLDQMLEKIEVEEFEALIEQDIQNGFVPMLLVANAGSYGVGQCDELKQLNELCYKHKMWIHLEGFYLSSLALYSVPTALQPVFSGDSITLNLPTWLGIPSLPCVTLYRNVENSSLFIQPFNSFLSTLQKCLPYWCVLQALGHEGVMECIKYAFDMGTKVQEILEMQKPYIKIVDVKNAVKPGTITTERLGIKDLITKALNLVVFVDLNNPIIVFKCDEAYVRERISMFSNEPQKPSNKTERDSFLSWIKDVEPFEVNDHVKNYKRVPVEIEGTFTSKDILDYTDTLTQWMCDLLNSLNKSVEFDLVEIESEGLCIRYSPLEHTNTLETNESDLEKLQNSLGEIIPILDSSIKCKSKFEKEIEEFSNLIPISVSKWAGIGAIRYVPDYLMENLAQINSFLEKREFNKKNSDSELEMVDVNQETNDTNSSTIDKWICEINQINKLLANKLQNKDNAFSLGEDQYGMVFIKFGMVNDLNAVKKLANQVQSIGKEIQENSKFLEKMNEMIRLGIEKANQDLKKEQEKLLVQEGLLRQIPIVSGLFNWLAPSQPANPTGRTFNLNSGKIATTEKIYKYHMQIEEKDDPKENEPETKTTETSDSKSENIPS